MMGITIIVCLGLLGTTMGGTRYTRDTTETEECKKAKVESEQCRTQAYAEYKKEFDKGDDKKKPDWLARKSCNYLTDTIETCSNKLIGACGDEDDINKVKDDQLKHAHKQVMEHVPAWKADKCPVVKAHLDRLAAAEAGEAEPTGSATSVQISVLFFLAMALIV